MSYRPPRRSARDYFLPFFIIVAVAVVGALSVRLIGQMDTGEDLGFTATGQAALNVETGEVEAYLPAVEAWKIIDVPGATLASSESVRTGADGAAYLVFDDGTRVVLDSSSEIALTELSNAFHKKTVRLKLVRGQVWVDTSAARKSDFEIATELMKVSNAEGAYLLARGSDKQSIDLSVASGLVQATALDSKSTRRPDLKEYAVEAGQTLSLTELKVNLIRVGGPVEPKETPDGILTSSFYADNKKLIAVTPAPAEAELAPAESVEGELTEEAAITEDADLIASEVEVETPTLVDGVLPSPVVTQPANNSTITAEPLEIRGQVSPAVTKVEVAANGGAPYELQAFVAGSGEFVYRAKVAFTNLKVGANSYSIVAIAEDGTRSEPALLEVTYETADTATEEAPAGSTDTVEPITPTGGAGVPVVGESLAAPTVSEPADGATFTTEPIAFTGTVPAGTESVEVNGYKLGQGFTGGTTWFYNASLAYENLKVGENEYEIEAITADGRRSSVTIKINFAPAETPAE